VQFNIFNLYTSAVLFPFPRSFEAQLAKQAADAELNKQEALSEFASEKEEEKRMALVEAGRQHDEKTARKLAEQQAFFEQNIRILQAHVREKKSTIKKLENQLMEMITAKDRIRQELFETREEFERFIHRVKPFNKIDPKFVMPAPKTITLGITEEEWRKLWQ
jgi:vacuolar-type H+-ATPase subunit I/STV1